MKRLTQEQMLNILCAPKPIDEPEGCDFKTGLDSEEEMFIKSWIAKEMT